LALGLLLPFFELKTPGVGGLWQFSGMSEGKFQPDAYNVIALGTKITNA